jgi:hypothetical protein
MTEKDANGVLKRLRMLMESIPSGVPSKKEDIRKEVKGLSTVIEDVRALAKLKLAGLTDAKAARDRILAYLKMFVGVVVDGAELQVVGGIQEFARRVRELRVQFGYKISTGYSDSDLRPDQYRLEKVLPDSEEAEKWRIVNGIRKMKGGARERILALLKAFVGKPITGDEISYVASIKEAARRVRELRSEFGWKIVTKQTGRPDLPQEAYVLETLDQLPEHDRKIPAPVYDEVLERDGYKCRKCGWSVEGRNPAGRRQFLEVHHIVHHVERGANKTDNLVTLCNVHHDDLHRAKIGAEDFPRWLKQERG